MVPPNRDAFFQPEIYKSAKISQFENIEKGREKLLYKRAFQNIPNRCSLSIVGMCKGYHSPWKVYKRVTFLVKNGIFKVRVWACIQHFPILNLVK